MYKTLKFHLILTQREKQFLLRYEECYHNAIQTCIENMLKNAKACHYHEQHFHKDIPRAQRWLVFKIAQKGKYLYEKKQSWSYHKSSSWSKANIKLIDKHIFLLFDSMPKEDAMKLKVACEDNEWEQVKEGRVIRVDLVHDEKYWFANILLQYKSDSICK